MKKEVAIVVGGGVVGIASSLLLKESYKKVYLLEKGPHVGGLLNSIELDGAYYDYGTHVPASTGIKELDSLLYENLDNDWLEIPYLKVANLFNGKWNPESPLVDLKSLDEETYLKALDELMSLPEATMSETNLGNFIEKYFGKTIADNVYRPIFKKLHGEDISNLAQRILYNFALHRVMLLDSKSTKELKKLPRLDSKIGFHSYLDVPPNKYLYPKSHKGCGEWISSLEKKLSASGVEIIKNVELGEIESHDGKINSIKVNNEAIDVDFCAWTVPTFLFKKFAGFESKFPPPKLRHSTLINVEFDKEFLRDNHYLLIWDKDYSIFRITIYSNLRGDCEKRNILSAEILSGEAQDHTQAIEQVKKELLSMGLTSEDHNVLNSEVMSLGPVFPVVSEEFLANAGKDCDYLEANFSNIKFLGKSNGKNFLLNNTLIEAFNTIKDLK